MTNARNLANRSTDFVSVKDFGAVGDGVTDDTARIESAAVAANSGSLEVPPGNYVARSAIIENPVTLTGSGAFKQDTANEAILYFGNATAGQLTYDARVIGTNFGPMPDASSDNWAAVNMARTNGGSISLARFKDVWTAIRTSYEFGTGTGATATAVLTGDAVTSVTVNTGGSGYTSVRIQFSGGGGTGAMAFGTVVNGVLTSVSVYAGGSGYTSAPTIAIDDIVDSHDNLFLGNYVENAKQFGVEQIQSDYNRIIGLAVQSNGDYSAQDSSAHGVRFSGSNQGSLLASSIIRDRKSFGVSLQEGARNCLVTGTYIENTGNDGIRASATFTIHGRHILAPVLIKNATASGLNLSYMSGCVSQVLVDTCGTTGILTGSVAAEGLHRIDGIVRNSGSAGANIRSDKNLVTVIVDGAAATPCNVSGSNNIVTIITANDAVSNAVQITGSNNVIVMNKAGTGTIGLRIDGANNVVTGYVTGNASVNGDGNQLNIYVSGNLTINVGGDNNKVSGTIAGTVADNGAGNDLTGLFGGSTRGSTTATTDASGLITVTHGCKKTPASVTAQIRMNAAYFCTVTAISSTTATVKVWDAAGAAVASTSVTVDWQAVI